MDHGLGHWVLLSGRRYRVAGVILLLMMSVVLVPGLSTFAIRDTAPLAFVASALITGNVTLITVVVAINQVILSQEPRVDRGRPRRGGRPLLGVDYATYIHDCTSLEASHDGDDHEALRETLDDLASDLENLDVARQYFTTAFMKGELATLSRLLLYVGVLAVSASVALLFQPSTYPGAAAPMPALYALSLLAVLFGLLPLALLIAFVLRIATVAQRIAVISPFET